MASPRRPIPDATQSGRPATEVASGTDGAFFLKTKLWARREARRLGTHAAKDTSKQPGAKHARHVGVMAAILALAIYFVPVLTLVMIGCGALDVRRHRKVTYELVEKYFMGNGILTWMLSPINLLADLLSYRNRVTYTLADLPAAHREEIETCVCEFVNHGDRIKAHIAPMLESVHADLPVVQHPAVDHAPHPGVRAELPLHQDHCGFGVQNARAHVLALRSATTHPPRAV